MENDRLENIYYFIDRDGKTPVKEFINSLPAREQTKIYAYITELKKQGNNLRRPIADYLVDGIYELRPRDNRVFYFFYLRNNAVLVHALKKHVSKIPGSDLRLCLKRKLEIEACLANIEKME